MRIVISSDELSLLIHFYTRLPSEKRMSVTKKKKDLVCFTEFECADLLAATES